MKLHCLHMLSCGSIATILFSAVTARAQMTTSQYDNARTGAYLNETTLTPRNVNPQHFGKIFTLKVDGDVYAQPLFLAGVQIPGKGRHDVLFIATEHDSVYAFDAYGNPSSPLWRVSFLKDNVTTVSADYASCPFIDPEIGITSTPVIDAKSGTLYALARTKEQRGPFRPSDFHQQLHALAVATGVEKFGGPTEIQAMVRGHGDGSIGDEVHFESLRENPRASLLMVNGIIYLTWGSSCDVGPYHGWVMAYDAHSLKQKAVFNTSPDADDSGIWAGDTGPAADQGGDIFLATGNGLFDVAKGGHDYGDSLLKLKFAGQSLTPDDYFAPFNVDELSRKDQDLGSGGPVLLPDQAGPHAHLAVIAGKGSTIYLIDRDRMGHYQAKSNSHAVQAVAIRGGVFGSMAYWNQNLFVMCDSDVLRDFVVTKGRLSFKAAGGQRFQGTVATPTVSANGLKDGIVWVLIKKDSPLDRAEELYAYDAANIAHTLYNSEQNPGRDRAGYALTFNTPTVVNGHVYVGAKREVDVYGLLPANSK
jgi:hypothetical protein